MPTTLTQVHALELSLMQIKSLVACLATVLLLLSLSTVAFTADKPLSVFKLYVLDRNDKVLHEEIGFFIHEAGIASISCEATKKWVASLLNTIVIETPTSDRYFIDDIFSKNCLNNNVIIKVKSKQATPAVLSSKKPTTGQSVFYYRISLDGKLTPVRSKIKSIRASDGLIELFNTLHPSSNGSPIFDTHGEVIAVAVYALGKSEDKKRFAIPIRHIIAERQRVKYLLDKFKDFVYEPESFALLKPPIVQVPEPPSIVPEIEIEPKRLTKDELYARKVFEGDRYIKIGNYRAAIQAYQEALSIKDDEPKTLQKLALALIATKEFALAVQAYQKALALLPNNEQLIYELAVAHALNNDKEAVIAQFKALKQLNSKRALQVLDLIY